MPARAAQPAKARQTTGVTAKRLIGGLLGLIVAHAHGFQVDQFRNGMSKAQVRAVLPSWKFDRIEDFSPDTVIAYDSPQKETHRELKFVFCADHLVVVEEGLQPSVKNLITILGNYLNAYGQPLRMFAANNVVANGQKSSLIMAWRVKNEIVAVRYFLYSSGENLSVAYEAANNCFPIPRN
jgi:hypothetical protein